MRTAVDLGYGFVKAVSDNGKRVMFPSVVAPDPGGKELAEALGSKPDYAVTVEHSGRTVRYLVGDAAATVRNGVRAWEGDQTEHHNTAILYATAIALLNVGPGPVDLACGLPLTAYGSQKGGLASFLQGFSARVTLNGGEPKSVSVGKVFAFPQAAGALYHAIKTLLTDGGKSLLFGTVGIIDPGYRTTDYLVMQKDSRGYALRSDLSGSLDMGYSRVYHDVKRALDERVGWTISVQTVERIITHEGAVAMIKGKPYDLHPDLASAERNLTDSILSQLKAQWGENLDLLSALVIAGGGGQRIFEHITSVYPEAVLVPDAVYANALGYMAAWSIADRRLAV